MDIIAHALWAFIIFPEGEYKFLALIFAVIPDITTTGPFLIYKTLKGDLFKTISNKKGTVPQMPQWLISGYKISHSIPLIILMALIFFILGLPEIILLYVFGSLLLHILIDIFLHDETYIKTQFLYPFSNFSIKGLNWASPRIILINYALIVIGLIIKLT